MYKVILHLTVQKGSHLLGLEKTVELPFVPFVGLTLDGLTSDEEASGLRIESVTSILSQLTIATKTQKYN